MGFPNNLESGTLQLVAEELVGEETDVVAFAPRRMSHEHAEAPPNVGYIGCCHHEEASRTQALPEALQQNVRMEDMLYDFQEQRSVVAFRFQYLRQRSVAIMAEGSEAELTGSRNVVWIDIHEIYLVSSLPKQQRHLRRAAPNVHDPAPPSASSPVK
jgi:hypothetical protein